ncbi:MAG: hypothetical protein Crog4KO_18550 [Crocinitomicaceae bacterium]
MDTEMNDQSAKETIIQFLRSINIEVIEKDLPDDTFLPGLSILGSTVLMDLKKLKYPGDLLHEAGHIATTEAHIRPNIGTPKMAKNWPSDGDEITTILWTYAASHHLNLDLNIVFHPNGYKDDSDWLIEQFSKKNYMGLPLLEWMELCDKETFPAMLKWMR